MGESRINGKVEERERDGLRAQGGAKGGRDRLIKVKGERNRSCGKNMPQVQGYHWFSVLTGRCVSVLRKGLDSCRFSKVNSQSFVLNLLQSLEAYKSSCKK